MKSQVHVQTGELKKKKKKYYHVMHAYDVLSRALDLLSS